MKMTSADLDAVRGFHNFLSWGEKPYHLGSLYAPSRAVPPAWWAYALGATQWCPPKGEL